MSVCTIQIVGRLGADPRIEYTPQGTAVCKFKVATNETIRVRGGEQREVTTWFRVSAWGKQAENVARCLSKGSKVFVSGRMHAEDWTDREGRPRQSLEVEPDYIEFLDPVPGSRAAEPEAPRAESPAPDFAEEDVIEV